MMKQIISYILLVFILASCGSDNDYIVEGVLHNGSSFEGETIYLAPFGSTSMEGVDSCIIRDARFRFEGKCPEPEICVLRMRPMMQLFLEQLVFIKEPGHVRISLSRPGTSTARGTALNDSLQNWKAFKFKADSVISKAFKEMKGAKGEDLETLQLRYDSLKQDLANKNKIIVNRNDNVFGDYIDRYVR